MTNSNSSSPDGIPENELSRRDFFWRAGALAGAAAIGTQQIVHAAEKPIQGFEKAAEDPNASKDWKPISDRKIRVGIVGYGVCKFAAAFGFQDHPNVEVVAVSDLIPERCAELAKVAGAKKPILHWKNSSKTTTSKRYSSRRMRRVTRALHRSAQTRQACRHGGAGCVWFTRRSRKVFEAVKKSGLKYMMFETSCFHEDLYAMRQIYNAGGFGKLVYSEGEYYHYMEQPIDSYKGWRIGLPPQWYPTHSNAYYIGVTGGSFTEVSCMGMPSSSIICNRRTTFTRMPSAPRSRCFARAKAALSRMAVSWDTPGARRRNGPGSRDRKVVLRKV